MQLNFSKNKAISLKNIFWSKLPCKKKILCLFQKLKKYDSLGYNKKVIVIGYDLTSGFKNLVNTLTL